MATIAGLLTELTGDTGSRIESAIRDRIAELAKALEGDLPERETAATRGALRELRSLLAPKPQYVSPLRYSGLTRGNE